MLKNPIMPSSGGFLSSAFSPFDSPNSPAPFGHLASPEKRSPEQTDLLNVPASPYPQQTDPSPTDSNVSETTDIEEDAQEGVKSPKPEANEDTQSRDLEITSPQSAASDLVPKIHTQLPAMGKSDDEPQSVIHAPEGFKTMDELTTTLSPTAQSYNPVVSPTTPEAIASPVDKKPNSPSPVNTDVPLYADRTTPRAQTRQDLDEDWKRRSRRASSLEDIEETDTPDKDNDERNRPSTAGLAGDEAMTKAMEENLSSADREISALRTALSECWTLCNTLASLSSSHRKRAFKYAGRHDVPEQAWQNCWRLCQKLYDSHDEDHASQVVPTLELCRDFCQSLFEAREKADEASDSVLRVSFELNNHLYNNQDRTLPDAFTERTLDFYITLCHRLMKQSTSLPPETDTLLRACWALAEMLFNLRQSNREGKKPDEELLGSAIQSCWELCDLFREGWTQVRPDRGTPRPTQSTFPPLSQPHSFKTSSSNRSDVRSHSSSSNRQYHDAARAPPPETPTTIFDDSSTAASSPESAIVPNILVLGPASTGNSSVRGMGTHHDRWTSGASVVSGYSESASSQRTSSTATATSREDHVVRIRCLLLRASMEVGFSKTSGKNLPAFVKTMPKSAFGHEAWQKTVLELYKQLVVSDQTLHAVHAMPSRRVSAVEVAKSVQWLSKKKEWAWMRDLYRIVLGFGIEEAQASGGTFET